MTDAHESTRAVLSASCALGARESQQALCLISLCLWRAPEHNYSIEHDLRVFRANLPRA